MATENGRLGPDASELEVGAELVGDTLHIRIRLDHATVEALGREAEADAGRRPDGAGGHGRPARSEDLYGEQVLL